MTSVNTTVLIVGGGPAGLLAGMLLDKLGIDFLIVERRADLHQAPQAHVISSRSLEICRAVGIDDASIRALGPDPMKSASVRWVDRLLGRDLGVFSMAGDQEGLVRMLTQSPTPYHQPEPGSVRAGAVQPSCGNCGRRQGEVLASVGGLC